MSVQIEKDLGIVVKTLNPPGGAAVANGGLVQPSLVAGIGRALENYRREKLHMSQRCFAQRVGISRHTLSMIEDGHSPQYAIGYVEKILQALGMDFGSLFDRAGLEGTGYVTQGTLKGEFQVQYPDFGLEIVSLTPRLPTFFFGILKLKAQRTVQDSALPHAQFTFFQGFRGKLLFRISEREHLLSEDKCLLFRQPALPAEIYNPDPLRESACFLFTVPSFL